MNRPNQFVRTLPGLLLLLLLLFCGCAMSTAGAASKAESQRTPDAVITRLKQGNQRYLTGVSEHNRIDVERRVETAKNGQLPYATILGCSDSLVLTVAV